MPERIQVLPPDRLEEHRQLAEVVADMDYVMSIIVENAKELIPGESVEYLTQAWEKSRGSMRHLVESIYSSGDANVRGTAAAAVAAGESLTPPLVDLENTGLVGETGKLKRSMLTTLKDALFMWLYSEPRTDDKRSNTAKAAHNYLDAGTTVIGSIPGGDKVIEIISLTKQLIGIRHSRGV